MDRFTRNYLIVFGAVVGGLVLWWGIANWQPQVWRLNGLLDDEPTLAAFSYRFRVLELVDGVASVTTPRTAEMPAARFLGILRPELAGRREDDAALIAAGGALGARPRLVSPARRKAVSIDERPADGGCRRAAHDPRIAMP